MKFPKYVQVSLDAPDEWWDNKSGMWFRKADGIIELKDYIDASNIVKYIRFNYLIDATSLAEPPQEEEQKVQLFIEKTPKQLLSEVEAVEHAEEPEVEEQEEASGKKICPYCGKELAPRGLANHMRNCKQRPNFEQE
jgi:hypothetical protein